jgi:hypothetical protein
MMGEEKYGIGRGYGQWKYVYGTNYCIYALHGIRTLVYIVQVFDHN